MQDLAYVVINGTKYKVLRQSIKYGVRLKLRQSGKEGNFLPDETYFLSESFEQAQKLLSGEVIGL